MDFHLTDEQRMLRHTAREFAQKELAPHAAEWDRTAQFPAENHFGAEVRIALKGGKALSGKIDQPFGRTSENALPASLLKEKFDNCAARALPGERVGSLYSAIQGFENLKDVRELTAIIAGESRKQAAA